MLRFLADENLDNTIIRALLRLNPSIDVVRVQDVGLSGADDPAVLEYAAKTGRVVLTHDVATMGVFAYDRVREGQPMPGVVEIPARVRVGEAARDLLLIAECCEEDELEGKVMFLPF